MDKHGASGERLVVGYDASAGSERALGWAIDRAGAAGQVLVVNGAKPQPDRLALPTSRRDRSARTATAEAVVDLAFLERDDLYKSVRCDSQVRDAARQTP